MNDLGAERQANTVMRLLKNSFVSTQSSPSNGKPYDLSVAGETLQNVREVIVPYGKSGYSYLFWHDKSGKQILILTVRHFRENAYRLSFPFL